MTDAELNPEERLICLLSSGDAPAKCMKSHPTSKTIQTRMWELLSPYRAQNRQCPVKIFPSATYRGGEAWREWGAWLNTVQFLLAPAPSSLLTEMFNWSLLSRTFPSAYKRNDRSSPLVLSGEVNSPSFLLQQRYLMTRRLSLIEFIVQNTSHVPINLHIEIALPVSVDF